MNCRLITVTAAVVVVTICQSKSFLQKIVQQNEVGKSSQNNPRFIRRGQGDRRLFTGIDSNVDGEDCEGFAAAVGSRGMVWY